MLLSAGRTYNPAAQGAAGGPRAWRGSGPYGLPHQVLENRSTAVYVGRMIINLPPEQEQWLKARIAHGEFASVDDGLRRMIADRMAFEASDLSWAKPYVDAGRAAAACGEAVSMDEAMADIDTHMASLQR